MRKLQKLGLMLTLLLSFMMIASTALAQQRANVGQLASGLLNVNVGAVQADIEIGDITLQDLINVEDVLNNNEIRVLENVTVRNVRLLENAEILTNALRDANILTDAQVVVGVLSDQLVFR